MNNTHSSRARSTVLPLVLTALFAALTAIGAFLRIPAGEISFTLQVFFTSMAGILLGPWWGAASQVVYVLLGLIGLPIFTEGGGLMYLGTTLEVTSGERYTMADIIPGHSRMGTRLTRFGYCEAQAQQQTLLAAPGEWLRGHEFHYSDFSPATPAVLACRKQRDGKTLQQWQGGWQSGSAFASYLHVHFAQRPTMLNHWLRAARRAL